MISGFPQAVGRVEAVSYAFKALFLGSIVRYSNVLPHKLEHCQGGAHLLWGCYSLIESFQPKWKRLSIDLLEINIIERYAEDAGVEGNVFSEGRV